jgi:hypothetical protein
MKNDADPNPTYVTVPELAIKDANLNPFLLAAYMMIMLLVTVFI